MPKKLTTGDFISRAKGKHGERYNYEKVNYTSMYNHITITCLLHGDFIQTPKDHITGNGCGCTICGRQLRDNQLRKDLSAFLPFFKAAHGDKYSYSKSQYVSGHKKIEIICPQHGSFFSTPHNHKSGTGCPLCYRDHHLTSSFIKRANDIHEYKYNYSLINQTIVLPDDKLNIICPEHGVFSQRKRAHISGQGCPSCRSSNSKSQKKWLRSLSIPNLISPKKLTDIKLLVDGYDTVTKTVYEFYGDFWHGNPKVFDQKKKHPFLEGTYGDVYNKTMQREKRLKDAGYNLITIWEKDWLSSKLKKQIT